MKQRRAMKLYVAKWVHTIGRSGSASPGCVVWAPRRKGYSMKYMIFKKGCVARFATWFAASLAAAGLWLAIAGLPLDAQNQDPGPAQYPQQDPQQGPPQYPQQDPQQGQPQYPQQDPQQGQPQYPPQDSQQGQPQYPPQGPPQDSQQGPPQYPQQDSQVGPAQSPAQGPVQAPGSVARVSFVQGGVQIASGGQTSFAQAVMNMPLVEGTRLQTGSDGQAEIEFNDGSVARLTPNSSLDVLHLGQDSVQLQQDSGLTYYELNVGQGHPPYTVQFANAGVAPTGNSIFRLDLDNVPEIAVMTGTVEVTGNNMAPANLGDNQTLRFQGNGNAPYTVAQSINPDSWDQWNQDRDNAIAQEATQQTNVRDQAGDSNNENWNDLDAYGNWYPMQGAGNVWVPSGVDAGWDPYGYGYWGYYPGFGYTWISGYPWGWLPYHCGAWNYYSFGWGWRPGVCGGWAPIAGFRGYPGYYIPARPVFRVGIGGPILSQRLVFVDRGPQSRGPWGPGHVVAFANHQATLNIGGRVVAPVSRVDFHSDAFAGGRGTTPGVRTVLDNRAAFSGGGSQYRAPVQSYRAPQTQPYNSFNQSRSTYAPRTQPVAPHYSAPPPRYSAPAPHYSAPPAYHPSAPAGRR
jgi:FecR protein